MQTIEDPTYLLNSEKFHWDSKTKTATAEVSCLQGKRFPLEQIYYGPHQLRGMAVRSKKDADKFAWFMLSIVERDNEGDLLSYVYEPIAESVNEFPALAGWKLVVFND